MSDLTQLLNAVDAGDPKAAEELLPLVYGELRKLVAAKMAREKPAQTLQATALVHEAWLRLAGSDQQEWRGRSHFYEPLPKRCDGSSSRRRGARPPNGTVPEFNRTNCMNPNRAEGSGRRVHRRS